MTVKITIDCMGGDHGPAVTVPAAVNFVRSHPDAHLMLVGLEQPIRAQLKKSKALDDPRLTIVPASEVVAMDDPVEVALRKKKDSSMRVALNLVKEGEAQACISAGNTGALMAVSRYVLKTLAGIERPAIAFAMPSQKGYTTVLDLGANVDCEPEHLLQFAEMGHALVSAIEGSERPTIGLLNIGEEVIKGNETIKRAGELLRAEHAQLLRQRGRQRHLQGHDRCRRVRRLRRQCRAEDFGRSREDARRHHQGRVQPQFASTKLMALVALPVLKRFKKRVDPAQYNGAALLGLRGLVIKSHGSAEAFGFEWAIKRGYDAVKNGVLERLVRAMEENAPAAREAVRRSAQRAARQPGQRRTARLTAQLAAEPPGESGLRYIRRHNGSIQSLLSRAGHRQLSAVRARHESGIGGPSREAGRRDERRMDRRAHRHPRASLRRAGRRRPAISRSSRRSEAIEAAGIDPQSIDLIIVATSTPDFVFPSTACLLQNKLGITNNGAAFDVQAVCSGFAYAVATADSFIRSGHASHRARRRRRDVLAHSRFQRPHHLRAVRRRRRRGRAAASEEPGVLASALHADGSHPRHLCMPGNVERRRGGRQRLPAHGRSGRVQAGRSRCWKRSRTKRSTRPACSRTRSTG